MRSVVIRFAVLLAAILAAATADAQPYCANYDDNTQNCGIPTLQGCQEALRGMGGSCAPDQTSQIPPNLMQRMFRPDLDTRNTLHPRTPSEDQPGGLNWMPPPPGQ